MGIDVVDMSTDKRCTRNNIMDERRVIRGIFRTINRF